MSFFRTPQGAGIALIVLSSLTFAVLDTVTKQAITLIPMIMLLWFRYTFQALLTFALRFPVQKRRLFSTPNPRFQALRGLLLLTSSACAFLGLQHLPVGEFTAIVMLSPLLAAAMAAWLLKDHVSRLRWTVMAAGLAGVLLIVHPDGQVFSWALLFPLLLIVANASFQVLTSRLSGEENPYTTHFYTGLVGALVMTPVVFFNWRTSALIEHWPWFVLVGLLATFGHLILIRAFSKTAAPVLIPYMYTQMAFAMLGGWIAFRHIPDHLAWLGIAVIAASGVGNALLSVREIRKNNV
jgi:drug/metabolite transporter (DMT)-like permease